MLPFVPVAIELYRGLTMAQRWAMACLVSFADRTGRAYPSLRTFARQAGYTKSTAGRHLASLVTTGTVTRTRKPGRGYVYMVDPAFLPSQRPRLPQASAQSPSRTADAPVPQRARQETKPMKNIEVRAPARASSLDQHCVGIDWRSRLRAWAQGQFWLPAWGPRPDEPNCFAPAALLAAGTAPSPVRSPIEACPDCDHRGFVWVIQRDGSRAAVKCQHDRGWLDSIASAIKQSQAGPLGSPTIRRSNE